MSDLTHQEAEISLLNIITFIQESWKSLAFAAIAGGAMGLGCWYFLGSYRAEMVLMNGGGADLVSWRSLQKTLPNLAEQILDESKAPEGQESLYRTLSNAEWWQKNAVATLGMSKAETKDLASTAGLESAGTSIVSFTLSGSGSTKQKAIENTRGVQNFLLQGASYLAIRSLLNAQESQLISADADISKKINSTQVELGYQQERLKSLEALAKRFPSEQKTISQVVDPKDSGAKYLPLSTQIIAVNTDINGSKEALERLKDTLTQMKILKLWVKQAAPVTSSSFDGLKIIKQLLEEEVALRALIDPTDLKSLSFVDSLRSTLIGIDVRYTKGFEANTAPTANKRGMFKSIIGGLALAFMLMLMVLLGRRARASLKSSGVK